MKVNTEPETAIPETKKNRVGKIIRWAARITSIPILGLVLSSLIPALGSFAISATDDKIIAIGLCGTCIGLLAGWRWAGIGGGLVVLSVAVMLTQGDSWLNPDPFSVAFGLQGILFLISWRLNLQSGPGAALRMAWINRVAIGVLVLGALAGAATICRGPGPTPVPKDKQAFVGVWENGAGFTMELTPEGRAKISLDKDSKVDSWNSPIAPGGSGVFTASFRGDDLVELTSGLFGHTKVYHLDRRPHPEGKTIKMIVNGSDPYKRSSGMVLTKKLAS